MQEHRLALGPSSYPQGALIVRSYGSRACAGMRARFFAARTAPFCRLSTRQRLVKTSPKPQSQPPNLHLRRLTSRIAELTRRRQLHQIFEEVKVAKKRHGKLNTIVMNAVMEACVHCGNVDAALGIFSEMAKPDGCGVDNITFATLLKGLGKAGRIDEAFQILESIERGTAAGRPKLSSHLIYGLLNALLESGDMRRANGLLARYRVVLREEGHSIFLYNLLIKGYTNTDFPLGALAVRDEILRQGLKPDKLTYNTLILSCVKSRRMDVAMGLLAEMKEEGEKANNTDLFPDTVTYTTLLQGFGSMKDLPSVQEIVMEMKSSPKVVFDRVAYTAIVDAFLGCGSTKDALCIFGEILKLAGENAGLRPKPHLFLSMMREFAAEGDFHMVQGLRGRMWSDSAGSISPVAQGEADELLMEAAMNSHRVDVAKQILSSIVRRGKWSSWTSRGGMVALRLEALSGFTGSLFSPCVLVEVSLEDPIEKHMTPFEEANPLRAGLSLRKVAMRFYRDAAVPIVDDWGSCVGIVHREDCREVPTDRLRLPPSPPRRAPVGVVFSKLGGDGAARCAALGGDEGAAAVRDHVDVHRPGHRAPHPEEVRDGRRREVRQYLRPRPQRRLEARRRLHPPPAAPVDGGGRGAATAFCMQNLRVFRSPFFLFTPSSLFVLHGAPYRQN